MQTTKLNLILHFVLTAVIAVLLYGKIDYSSNNDTLCPAITETLICMIGP